MRFLRSALRRNASIFRSDSIVLPGTENQVDSAPKYAGKHIVTLLPGDGVGLEVSNSVKSIFSASHVPIDFEQLDIGKYANSSDFLKRAIDSIRRNKVGLKGIYQTKSQLSLNVALRQQLDLYASIALLRNPISQIDIVLIRENTEGEYSGLEHQPVDGVVESLKVVTSYGTKRIARFALDLAKRNARSKVTIVHKANIMKLTDGLFLRECRDVAVDFASCGIKCSDMIVDNAAMQMVSNPQQFDVVVLGNLYGSILSNIGAALVGGAGVVPGANIGRDFAVFEPGCRHVGADISGKNIANPTALIKSSIMMLHHLRLHEYASRIELALLKTISEAKCLTKDMGGSSSTTEFTKQVISNL